MSLVCMSHSNIPDQVGNPRLVAGFSDAYFEESDGSAASFFGTFVALSEPFSPFSSAYLARS